MQKWLWKNTDFLPKKGLFQLTRKRKGGKKDTCWQFNANMTSVFRLEIMHQQKYKYNFFHSCVSEKTYVEKLRDDYYPLFKISMATEWIQCWNWNVQCFLINLIYIVGQWNATNKYNIENSSLFSIKTVLLFTGGQHAANFLSLEENWSRVCEAEREARSQRQVCQDYQTLFP